jgi:hypothetical protein
VEKWKSGKVEKWKSGKVEKWKRAYFAIMRRPNFQQITSCYLQAKLISPVPLFPSSLLHPPSLLVFPHPKSYLPYITRSRYATCHTIQPIVRYTHGSYFLRDRGTYYRVILVFIRGREERGRWRGGGEGGEERRAELEGNKGL